MLTFSEQARGYQEWNTIPDEEKPDEDEYIFVIDLGGHFLFARPERYNPPLHSPEYQGASSESGFSSPSSETFLYTPEEYPSPSQQEDTMTPAFYPLDPAYEDLIPFLFEKPIPTSAPVQQTTTTTTTTQNPPPANNHITFRYNGDILQSSMHAIVNTVNCVGVMGAGIALAFKKRFPDMYKDYAARCNRQEVKLGEPYCYRSQGKIIINFPTKNHWKGNSQLEWIRKGLQYMAAHLQEWGVQSLALPPLGCGLGNLSWDQVRPLMLEACTSLTLPVEIYAPYEAPPVDKKRPHATTTTASEKKSRFLQPEAN
jgi:O-acetyl-ADP-ribose deacetylase (regulator of RNase III)